MSLNVHEGQGEKHHKNYPVGTLGYQKKVLDVLVRRKKITPTTSAMWKSFATLSELTKFVGVNVDFIAGNQTGFINIARKVHQNQISMIGANIAGEVKLGQWQGVGLQGAREVGQNQEIFFLGLGATLEQLCMPTWLKKLFSK